MADRDPKVTFELWKPWMWLSGIQLEIFLSRHRKIDNAYEIMNIIVAFVLVFSLLFTNIQHTHDFTPNDMDWKTEN